MSEPKHSQTPWRVFTTHIGAEPFYEIQDSEGERVGDITGDESGAIDKENARRIVACVNALAGIPTESLEAGHLAQALKAAERIATVCAVDGLYRYETRDVCDALRALGRLP